MSYKTEDQTVVFNSPATRGYGLQPALDLSVYQGGMAPMTSLTDKSHDNYAQLQGTLNDAAALVEKTGMGLRCELPATQFGWYVHHTTGAGLKIPTGVSLVSNREGRPGVGSFQRISTLGSAFKVSGALLATDGCQGSALATDSFLTIQRNARAQGLTVFHMDQDPTLVTPYTYPPAVQFDPNGSGKYGGGVLRDCMLINPWIGVQAVSHDDFIIDRLRGQPLSVGINADTTHNTPHIADVQFWQYWHELGLFPNLDNYIANNAIAFNLLDLDQLQGHDLFCYGYYTGLVLGSSGVGGYGQMSNIGVDGGTLGIVYQEGAYPWQLQNVALIITKNGTAGRGILMNSSTRSNSGELQIENLLIQCGNGTPVEVTAGSHQPLKISGRIHDWVSSSSAIKTASTDADIRAEISFWSSNSNHLDISALDNTATANIDLRGSVYMNGAKRRIAVGATRPEIRGVTAGGLSSVAAGTSSLVVSHGLGVIPTQVEMTPLTDTQGLRWWASTFSSTQFTINLSGNAVTNPVTFAWTVKAANE